MDFTEMTRLDALKALAREKGRNALTKAREAGVTERGMDVLTHTATAALAVAVPAWFFNADPEMTYWDEEKTIENEGIAAGFLLGVGVISYIAAGGKPKYRKAASHALTAGIASGSSYLGHVVRTKAQKWYLEEQAATSEESTERAST